MLFVYDEAVKKLQPHNIDKVVLNSQSSSIYSSLFGL